MSLFSGDMLAKANKVNQDVSDKIAKIKAMQEQILRPAQRESKSKSSVRSGRQMSDHDYDSLTKGLVMGIQLKKITGSEIGSDLDVMSDRGENNKSLLKTGAAATVEYFAPDTVPQAKRKSEINRKNKRS